MAERGAAAAASDPLLANLLAADLVPVGRSTTPEFGDWCSRRAPCHVARRA
jgi:Asp-tRNA(Asn)/Glu-tRNA(Gln) amidotransferase A subunit family amidase